jgi:hypothetical protein
MRPLYPGYVKSDFSLSHGYGTDRHVRVKCPCGRDEEFMPGIDLLIRGLGGQRLVDLEKRLRCTCGRVGEAELTIYSGPSARLGELPERYRIT